MRRAIASVIETVGGLCLLFCLAARTGFRFRGPYWKWRQETAFGGGEPEAGEKRRMIRDYARWLWRMRRYR